MLDQERLLSDPLLSGDGSEDDAGMIEALMAGREARDIAAALVRLYRTRLPAAEEVGDPGFGRDERRPVRTNEDYAAKRRPFGRDEGEEGERPRKPAGPRGDTVWFRLDIGRKQGADPRQLLPMLCRRGRITRDEVGAIRIFDRETKVEIDADVADRFYELAKVPDRDRITIEPTTEAERRPAKSFGDKAERPAAPRKSWDGAEATGDAPQRPRYQPKDGGEREPRGEDRKPYRPEGRPQRDDARPRRDDGKPAGGGFKKPFAAKGKPFAARPERTEGGRPAGGGKPFGKGKPRRG